MIGITVSSHETSYIYIFDSHLLSITISPIWLWVFPSGKAQVYLRNVSTRENRALNNYIFWCVKVCCPNTIIFTILIQIPIPKCRLENILSPKFWLKSSNRSFLWYLGEWSKNCSNSSQILSLDHHSLPHLLHAHSKLLYYTSDLTELSILLTNSTLLTADTIQRCKKKFPNWQFSFAFPKKQIESPALSAPTLSHLTPRIPTESNLYLAS